MESPGETNMSSVQSEEREEVISTQEITIQINEKRKYVHGEFAYPIEAVIKTNKETTTTRVDKHDSFDYILRKMKRKLDILPFLSEEGYSAMKKEILMDIATLLYKLEKGDRG